MHLGVKPINFNTIKNLAYKPAGVPFQIKGVWYMFKLIDLEGPEWICKKCILRKKDKKYCEKAMCQDYPWNAIVVRCTIKGIEYNGEKSYTRFDKLIELPVGKKFFFEGIKVSFEKESILGSPCHVC